MSIKINIIKTKRFLPLFLTQFLGGFNDNIFKNALSILITYRLANLLAIDATSLVILAGGIFILPFFLLSATAGHVADKYEKSRLIIIIKISEIILMAAATYGFYLQNLYLLLLVLFSLGVHSTFFGPLKYAILPDHLQENELIAGNAYIEAATFLAILLGTILGSFFILYPHGEVIISFFLLITAMGGFITSCFIPKSQNYNCNLKINYNLFKDTIQLIQHVRHRREIFLIILGISWFWLFGSIFLLEFPVFAKDVLHANATIVTLFLILFSIGLGIGSILCNRLLKGKLSLLYVPLGAIGMTIATIDLYFAAKVFIPSSKIINLSQFLTSIIGWHISLDLLFIAISGGIFTVPLYAALQYRSEKDHRARIIASNNVINSLAIVLACLAAMLMVKLGFSVTQIFLTVGILNGLVALTVCKLLPDDLLKGFFYCLLKVLYRVKIKGIENYHATGERFIVIANHTSFIDALLLATFLPDKLTFAVNTITAKKWWVKIFLRLVNTYSVDPTKPIALKSLIHLVQKNVKCVIFPEGRLSTTGSLMKIYEGPGLIADKSGAKLLPIHIQGSAFTPLSRLRGKVRIRWMPKITITIFPPQEFSISPEIRGKKRRTIISNKLYDLMTDIQFACSNNQQTLFDSLLTTYQYSLSKDILEDVERQPITYKQLITRCFLLGNIISKKTQLGEYVGVLLPNTIANVTTFFALQAFSRIPAMLNYSTGANNIINACHTAKIKTVYSSHRFVELGKLTAVVIALQKANVNIIYLEDLLREMSIWDKLKGIGMGLMPRIVYKLLNSKPMRNSNNAAAVLFTSGSEGMPKGVVLSHCNIQANRHQLASCIDFTAQDKVFNALPLFHSFGLTAGLLLPLLSDIKIFLYPSPLHYRMVPELTYDTNATILFGTDTFLSGYAKRAHQYDFYSVRYVFAGAEKLRDETIALWSQKFGLRILEGYGATETSPVLTINTPMQNKMATVGRFLPGIRHKLNSVTGINEGGELCVFGPNVMKGYLLSDQPGKLVSYDKKWYETGDIAAIDEYGFVTIKGRIKRFAKIAGEMVSLMMVEQQISKLWPNDLHAVIQMPDEKKGEQLILATTYLGATRTNLIAFAKENHLSELAIPKKIMLLQKMPLLGSGKIDYPAVKEIVAKQTI